MNIVFLLFCFPKPRNQVRILIYRNWSIRCVQTIEPERDSNWGGHFHAFLVFMSTLTSTEHHCSLECGKASLFESEETQM